MNDPLNDIYGGLPRVSVFVAKLDGVTWQEQYLLADGTWVDCTDGRRNTEAGPFEAVSLDPGMELMVAYETPSGYRYAKVTGGNNGVFPVVLVQDGGNDGGATPGTKPTWTYTLKDYEDGTTILKKADGTNATGMTPVKPRLPARAAAATVGLAYRKADGTLVLLEAYENYGYEACEEA
jgi:hypothetical protein